MEDRKSRFCQGRKIAKQQWYLFSEVKRTSLGRFPLNRFVGRRLNTMVLRLSSFAKLRSIPMEDTLLTSLPSCKSLMGLVNYLKKSYINSNFHPGNYCISHMMGRP